MTAHKSLTDLIKHHGPEAAKSRSYEVTFPDGTKRYAVGKSPKDAAAKVCEARLCTHKEMYEAALEGLIEKGAAK